MYTHQIGQLGETFNFGQLLQEHLQLGKVHFILKSEWGSVCEEYRQKIRQYIFQNIRPSESLLGLHLTPQIAGLGLSISHCKSIGGFLSTTESESIGFDIEDNYRLQDQHARRFAIDQQEIEAAPSPVCLWTAKEAAFKAIPLTQQPPVIAQIEIGKWQEQQQNVYTCQALAVKGRKFVGASGLVIAGKDQTVAFFKLGESELCAGF